MLHTFMVTYIVIGECCDMINRMKVEFIGTIQNVVSQCFFKNHYIRQPVLYNVTSPF